MSDNNTSSTGYRNLLMFSLIVASIAIAHADIGTFEVSRESSLNVSSEHNISSDIVIFDEFEVYANYTNSTDPISTGECNFSGEEDLTMEYEDSSEIFTTETSYTVPGWNNYTVYCEDSQYDSAEKNGSLYIYPELELSYERSVVSDDGSHEIKIDVVNDYNKSAASRINEFIPSGFYAEFDDAPDNSEEVSGHFSGEVFSWQSILEEDENLSIEFSIHREADHGNYLETYIIGHQGEINRTSK